MPIPTDPLLGSQWHLDNPNAALRDLNVFGVWNPAQGTAYTGAGTRTVVIDDGIDYGHSRPLAELQLWPRLRLRVQYP